MTSYTITLRQSSKPCELFFSSTFDFASTLMCSVLHRLGFFFSVHLSHQIKNLKTLTYDVKDQLATLASQKMIVS